jgi:hypothetical protein
MSSSSAVNPETTSCMGLKRADRVAEALEMAQEDTASAESERDLHAHLPAVYVRGELAAGRLRGFQVLIPFLSGGTKRRRNMSG